MLKRLACAGLLFAGCALTYGETGYDAWLRYTPIEEPSVRALYDRLPANVVALDRSPVFNAAQAEMARAFHGILGRTLRVSDALPPEDAILLATFDSVQRMLPQAERPALPEDGFWLKSTALNGHNILLIAAPNDRGVLYGVFALLRKMLLHARLDHLDEQESPPAPIRWVNQWDNLDGSIERGYAGRSIFFEGGRVVEDLRRASDYARLLASVGIDGCTVNNVNASPRMLASDFVPELARIAQAFRPWGVRLSIAVDFASPKTVGGLDTFDPLDQRVAKWWRDKADEIYHAIPDFGGFVLKADSEGRVGPSTYGRTHADAANVLAQALEPHGGILIYRGFVYNHHMDWRDLKNDRARAAYDNFHPLDGKFAANAAVQVKYGPIDFQAREPVSPLIAGLPNTKAILELQITQEYTGQQRHLCYLAPMWKEVLQFSRHTLRREFNGFAGVANVGRDLNWLGSDLAMSNLYGFGRLAWNPDLPARQITEEWTRMTFGDDARVVDAVMNLELESWRVYEGYTGPLGLGTLTDILHSHYGPGIESAEHNGWGQWIRADHEGIGMDRTIATGTGYIGQYPPQVAAMYESLERCPDNLLLFMHHVPYTHVLHSGNTVIQYVYDSHYDAAAEAQQFPRWWQTLRGRIDEQRYLAVLAKLEYQAGHAIVWRDAICSWFLKESGIPDAHGRAGSFPSRIEAESMQLAGYVVRDVTPWEDASGGKAIECVPTASTCTAQFRFDRAPGWYDLNVQYFDVSSGAARFRLFIGSQQVDQWIADAVLPTTTPNGDSSTRRRITGLALRPGDMIRIEGVADGSDTAALDYIEFLPHGI